MRENKTTNWVVGLPMVEHQKNRKLNKGINCSPFLALYGHEAFNGLEAVTGISAQQKKGIFCDYFVCVVFSIKYDSINRSEYGERTV